MDESTNLKSRPLKAGMETKLICRRAGVLRQVILKNDGRPAHAQGRAMNVHAAGCHFAGSVHGDNLLFNGRRSVHRGRRANIECTWLGDPGNQATNG